MERRDRRSRKAACAGKRWPVMLQAPVPSSLDLESAKQHAVADAPRFDAKTATEAPASEMAEAEGHRDSSEKPAGTVEYAVRFSEDKASVRSSLKNALPEAVKTEEGGAKEVDSKKYWDKKADRRVSRANENSYREIPARLDRVTVRPATEPELDEDREVKCFMVPTDKESLECPKHHLQAGRIEGGVESPLCQRKELYDDSSVLSA